MPPPPLQFLTKSILILTATLILALASCNTGSDTGGSGGGSTTVTPQKVMYGGIAANGDAYTLEIEEAISPSYSVLYETDTLSPSVSGKVAYIAQSGDTYVLTLFLATGGNKTKTGTVKKVETGQIILNDSVSVTITVTITVQGEMEKISGSGSITWDDNTTTKIENVTLTPPEVKDLLISKGVLCKYMGAGGSVTIPDDVTKIGPYAFFGCKSLTSVSIPNSVTFIGSMAFNGCTKLASVTIGNKVSIIGDNDSDDTWGGVFQGCTSLTSIIIPDSVIYISLGTFVGCTKLASVTLGSKVNSITSSTFNGCTSLTSIIIPNSVNFLGRWAFVGCTSLTSVTFQGTITEASFSDATFGYNGDGYIGDLRDKYLDATGGPGKYTRPSGSDTWTKQK